MNERTYAFPRAARLLKTDEFSSVFVLRAVKRSSHFVLYARPNTLGRPRLGVVIAKRWVRQAVKRNLLKRQIREVFRTQHIMLPNIDVVFRLHTAFGQKTSISRRAVRIQAKTEIQYLLNYAVKMSLKQVDV